MFYNFSKKQAGVIYKTWRQNKIDASKHVINKIYEFAENGIKGFGRNSFSMNDAIYGTVNAIFEGDYEKAQRQIDHFAHQLEEYELTERINAKARVAAFA